MENIQEIEKYNKVKEDKKKKGGFLSEDNKIDRYTSKNDQRKKKKKKKTLKCKRWKFAQFEREKLEM